MRSKHVWAHRAGLCVEVVVAALAALVFWHAGYSADQVANIAENLAAVSGTVFGFILAAVSILVALPDRRLISNMRITGHYGRLVRGMVTTAGVLLAVIVFGLAALFLDAGAAHAATAVAVGAAVLGLLATVSTGERFIRVLMVLHHSD